MPLKDDEPPDIQCVNPFEVTTTEEYLVVRVTAENPSIVSEPEEKILTGNDPESRLLIKIESPEFPETEGNNIDAVAPVAFTRIIESSAEAVYEAETVLTGVRRIDNANDAVVENELLMANDAESAFILLEESNAYDDERALSALVAEPASVAAFAVRAVIATVAIDAVAANDAETIDPNTFWAIVAYDAEVASDAVADFVANDAVKAYEEETPLPPLPPFNA